MSRAILADLKVKEDQIKNDEDRVKLYEMWSMKNVYNMEPEPFKSFDIWKTPMLLDYRVQEKEIITAMTENTNLVEMKDQPCSCGYTRFYISIKQLRSLDEAATTIYQCGSCNKIRRVG